MAADADLILTANREHRDQVMTEVPMHVPARVHDEGVLRC